MVEQRGTIAADYTVAREAAGAFYERLRQLFAERNGMPIAAANGHSRAVSVFSPTIDEVVREAPCDIAVVKQRGTTEVHRILVPVRGGPTPSLPSASPTRWPASGAPESSPCTSSRPASRPPSGPRRSGPLAKS